MGLPLIITAVGAIGAGIQYAGAQSAAQTQETLALVNAQTQTQSIKQQGDVARMQSSMNEQLARADQRAAQANEGMLRDRAEADMKSGREALRRSRAEAAKFIAGQRARIAGAGVVDTTGSPLALLARTKEQSEQTQSDTLYTQEGQQQSLLGQAAIQKTQAQLAKIGVTGQKAAGVAATQAQLAQLAQTKLDLYGQRASASAARTQGAAGLFTQFGGLARNYYDMKYRS